MTKQHHELTPRERALLRKATTNASSKFTIGGHRKEGKRAPRPITLRRPQPIREGTN